MTQCEFRIYGARCKAYAVMGVEVWVMGANGREVITESLVCERHHSEAHGIVEAVLEPVRRKIEEYRL